MKMHYFMDITRIYARSWRVAPTGIDRVEWAFAQYLRQARETAFVATLPAASGMLAPKRVDALFQRIAANWNVEANAASDAVFEAVCVWLRRPADISRSRTHRMAAKAGHRVGPEAAITVAADALGARGRLQHELGETATRRNFLNVSHLQIDQPQRFAWTQRHRVPVTLMLHDVIPIDYPEFCRPGAAKLHLARLKGAAQLRARLIVNSHYTRERVAHYYRELQLEQPEMLVAPLGIEAAFKPSARQHAPVGAGPYFVCVGTLEPRKNLIFLLEIWRRMAERHPNAAPRLVLVGHRGWENRHLLTLLDRATQITPHVMEVSGLSDAGLAALMAGANGVLAPSSVEGYSLPVVEALACGAAVVASDIPVHREVCGTAARLIGPLDGLGWIEAIEGLLEGDGMLAQNLRMEAASCTPLRWSDQMRSVMGFLDGG